MLTSHSLREHVARGMGLSGVGTGTPLILLQPRWLEVPESQGAGGWLHLALWGKRYTGPRLGAWQGLGKGDLGRTQRRHKLSSPEREALNIRPLSVWGLPGPALGPATTTLWRGAATAPPATPPSPAGMEEGANLTDTCS